MIDQRSHDTRRKKARGPYREPTTPIRVPRSLLGAVEALLAEHRRKAQTKGAA